MGNRSQNAAELLANSLFMRLMDEFREDYFNQWIASNTVEERESVYTHLNACEEIISQLQAITLETSK